MIKSSVSEMPTKTIDTSVAIPGTATGVVGFVFFPTVQGIQNGMRTGDEIELLKVDSIRQYIYGDPTYNFVRLIVFQIAGPAPATPLVPGDILSPDFTGSPGPSSFIKPFYQNAQYIRVLLDECKGLTGPQSAIGAINVRSVLRPRVATIPFFPTSVNTMNGVMYYLVIADSSIIPHPLMVLNFRVHYKDI